jgi:membrane protein implicated in regulation of membrane protease activity
MQPDLKPDPRQDASPAYTDEFSSDRGTAFVLVAALHSICCGLLLLLISGVSLAFLAPFWAIAAGGLAALGLVGFAWYLKRAVRPARGTRAIAPLTRGRDQLG